MPNRMRLTDLTPSEISRITQKAALVEAEFRFLHQRSGAPLNEDDSVTLRTLSVFTVANSIIDGDDGK